MIIRWLEDAVSDLRLLRHYIFQTNPIAARRVVKRILQAINRLPEQPSMGRPGRVANTRELVVSSTSYIVPYRVEKGTIEILRVFHCAMQWPKNI